MVKNVGRNSWIGLKSIPDVTDDSGYKWIYADGEDFSGSPTYWQYGPPAQTSVQKNYSCVEINQAATTLNSWSPISCDQMRSFVCQKPEGICPSGWLQHQTTCYQMNFRKPASWKQAAEYCQSQGSNLLTIAREADQLFLNRYISRLIAVGAKSVWIGLSDIGPGDEPFQWSTGETLGSFQNWVRPPLKNQDGTKRCVYILTGDAKGQWQVGKDCLQQKPFICNKPVKTKIQIRTTTMARTSCEVGWWPYQDACYLFNNTDVSWTDARSSCQSGGADLVRINSDEIADFISGRIRSNYWIGLNDRKSEGVYVWGDDMSQAPYTRWNAGEPNNYLDEDCVAVIGSGAARGTGWWFDYQCSGKVGFICEKHADQTYASTSTVTTIENQSKFTDVTQPPLITKLTTPQRSWSKECGLFWDKDPNSQNCYQFRDEQVAWSDAQKKCKMQGGDLLSITSLAEQFYISGRLHSLQSIGLWIGANNIDSEKGWQWTDASPFAFMRWKPGEPNNLKGLEHCVSINTKDSAWSDRPCNEMNGYICKKQGIYSTTTLRPQTTVSLPDGKMYGCPGGWIEFGDRCFLFVQQSKTWMDSRLFCKENGGNLASISNMVEQNFIMSQLPRDICLNTHGVDKKCDRWAADNECRKNPLWMSKNCRQSCNICIRTCQDTHNTAECQSWAKKGECKKNPNWMFFNCHRSCDGCNAAAHGSYWIGLNDRQRNFNFKWSDGSSVKYTNWQKEQPSESGGRRRDCTTMFITSGQWSNAECDNSMTGFVCSKGKQLMDVNTESPHADGCEEDSLGYGAYCYYIGSTKLSWQGAEAFCESFTGTLAVVNDRYSQAFLASQLVGESGEFWIGMADMDNPGTYKWINNASVSFTYWSSQHTGNERITCVGMQTAAPVGLWVNRDCSSRKRFICQIPRIGYTTPTPPPSPPTLPDIPCTTGFYEYQGYCYKAYLSYTSGERLSWLQARLFCQGYGGDLVSIHSTEENSFIKTSVLKHYRGGFWIGLNERSSGEGRAWSDGTAVDYTNWNYGEPNNHNGLESCVEYSALTEKWSDNNCFLAKNHICKIKKGMQQIKHTPPPPTTPVVPCGVDGGNWMFSNGYCYYVSLNWGADSRKSWYEARDFCHSNGGNLLSINSKDENNFITSVLSKKTQTTFWIGLNNLDLNGYRWIDESPLVFYNWNINEPNDAYGGQRCVDFYGSNGFWNDDNCNDLNGFICKRINGTASPQSVIPTSSIQGGCLSNFVPFGNKCLYLGGRREERRLNWTNARKSCRNFGKGFDLASIHSRTEQALLITLVKGIDVSFWIGLNDMNINTQFQWQDNSPVIYTNWDIGEPTSGSYYSGAKKEDCVEMKSRINKAGRWNDQLCSQKRGYICQGMKDPALSTPQPPTSSCISGYTSYGSNCYKVQVKATTWKKAEENCVLDGGHLASILEVYEQSYIEVLASNGVGGKQFWIGLSDVQVAGTYIWSDKWPVYYTNWGKNEPTKENGGGCVAMNGGMWNDTLCSQNLQSICKISPAPFSSTAHPSVVGQCTDKSWPVFGDYCYYPELTAQRSWPDANYICQSMGMSLISIHSKKEKNFILNLLENSRGTSPKIFHNPFPDIWIGLNKGPEGGFKWSDGSPAEYMNFGPGEPSGLNGTFPEYCVEMYNRDGAWNDLSCLERKGFICKSKKVFPTATSAKVNKPLPKYQAIHSKSGGITTGKVLAIVVGCIGLIIVVLACIFVVLRLRVKGKFMAGKNVGFDNALYDRKIDNSGDRSDNEDPQSISFTES